MKNLFLALVIAFSTQATFAATKLTFGATAGDFADMVKDGLKPILDKKGYEVKLVEFTDYVTPNIALSEGSLDANIFQHKPYMEQFAKEKGLHLATLAQVPTAPLGLYAGKLKALKDVKNGSTVALANDPTNLSRALTILVDLKWIEVAKNANPFLVSVADITKNPKNLKIMPLEAAQLPRSAQDVDFAIINGNYATNAGIALTSALAQEKSDLYINYAVVTEKNVNAKFAKDIVDALNSTEFKAYAKNRFKGYKYPASWR